MLRPLDIVVMLKLSLENRERPPVPRLANELHLYPSEVYASVKRARAWHLVRVAELGDRLNRSWLLEFLIHGVRYAFPAEIGPPTRGVPTGYAASPLSKTIADAGELPPVWPSQLIRFAATALRPTKDVPQAALEDERLYELLALVDALRSGQLTDGRALIHRRPRADQ